MHQAMEVVEVNSTAEAMEAIAAVVTDPRFPLQYYEDLASNKKFLRTRKCGCGSCRFTEPTEAGCELKSSKTAIWLYTINPSRVSSLVNLEEGDPGYELKEVTGTEV